MGDILHPDLFNRLSDFFKSTCTIQETTEVQDSTGHPVDSWAEYPDHEDLPCSVIPFHGRERNGSNQLYTVATHYINLTDKYETITEKMRVVSGGKT